MRGILELKLNSPRPLPNIHLLPALFLLTRFQPYFLLACRTSRPLGLFWVVCVVARVGGLAYSTAYLCPWLRWCLFLVLIYIHSTSFSSLFLGLIYVHSSWLGFGLIFGTYLYPFKLVGVWTYFLGLIYIHSTSFSSLFLGLIFCSRGRGLAYSTWMGWCLFLGFTFGLIVVSMI